MNLSHESAATRSCQTCKARGATPWFLDLMVDGSPDGTHEIRFLCKSCIRIYTNKCLRLRPTTEDELTVLTIMER